MFGFKKKSKNLNEFIRLSGSDKKIYFAEGESILDICIREEIPLDHSCGGMGSCGTCKVAIAEGLNNLDERNEIETEWANERGLKSNERLGCQTLAVANVQIKLPKA